MFVLNKAHARAFQGRIHQKFLKGGRGQNFFRWRLKANKKRSRELLHFLDFYKNNEKVYEIKPKKKIKRVEGGGGSRDRRWIEKIICFCCTSLWVHWTYSFNIQAILLQRIYFMPRVYPMIMFQNRVVKSVNLAIFESSLFRSLLCNFRMHIFHDPEVLVKKAEIGYKR